MQSTPRSLDDRSKFGAGYVQGQRAVSALETALGNGDLEVVKTPVPVFYDPTLDKTNQLKLDNGVLLLADPCWLATSSSAAV